MIDTQKIVDSICNCRRGSMDDKQFRATVEFSIQEAIAEDRESVRKDYIKWVLSDNYKRKYTGETPFREWKEKAEAQDMSNWE